MARKRQMGAVLFLSCFVFCAIGCDDNEVAIYEVTLNVMWSEDRLPKDYSTGPGDKIQWSPVFGQSHNRSYVLYRVGDVARPAVQSLVRTGGIDDLMLQGEEEPKVYNQFSAPGIGSGVGATNGLVVVDGEHSLVSLICRIMPSTGWFVGVDSIDMCIDSSWVDQVTLDLEPLSVGASSKDSFENDYSTLADPVTKLGSKVFNNHVSGFFKSSRALPTVAKVEFTKKEVYSSEEINKLVRNDVIAKLKQKDQNKSYPRENRREESKDFFSDVTTKSYVEHLMDLEEEPVGTPAPNRPENNVMVVTRAPNFETPKEHEDEIDDELMSMDDAVLAVAQGRKLGLNKHLPRHFKSRLHHAVNHRPQVY